MGSISQVIKPLKLLPPDPDIIGGLGADNGSDPVRQRIGSGAMLTRTITDLGAMVTNNRGAGGYIATLGRGRGEPQKYRQNGKRVFYTGAAAGLLPGYMPICSQD